MTYTVSKSKSPRCWIALLLLPLLAVMGCRSGNDSEHSSTGDGGTTKWRADGEADGQEILARMRAAYAAAETYQDEAILSVSYRLQGKYLEEPHQWRVTWDRQSGAPHRFRASVFNARLRSDGQNTGCFVFDFGSGNLGNQWQIHPATNSEPWQRFFRDGLCRYYLTGQNDMPIDTSDPFKETLFFPPTLGLLGTGSVPVWLLEGETVRLADAVVDGHTCHQIDLTFEGLTFRLAVDSESYVIRRINYPVAVLDGKLQSSPDVSDFSVVADFKGATFANAGSDVVFALETPPDAIRVRRFVPVPEPFPSPNIGKPLGALGLIDERGTAVNQGNWRGKVTVLAWVGDELSEPAMDVLQAVAKTAGDYDPRDYEFVSILVVTPRAPGEPPPEEALTRFRIQWPINRIYGDAGFAGADVLGLTAWPALVVVDREGVVQFARTNFENTEIADELRSVLLRVRSGDDVAAEMRRDYERFLEIYQDELDTARAEFTAASDEDSIEEVAVDPRLAELWRNTELRQPGNLIVNAGGSCTVIDGWRTIVQISAQGELTNTWELELPPRESISLIRNAPQGQLLFQIAGRYAYLWNPEQEPQLTTLPARNGGRIRDARGFAWSDSTPHVAISQSDQTGAWWGEHPITPGQFGYRNSAYLQKGSERFLLVCNNDSKLVVYRAQDASGAERERLFGEGQSVATSLETVIRVQATTNPDGRTSVCCVGTDSRGDWRAVVLDEKLSEIANVLVGNQQFSTQIEPIAHAADSGAPQRGYWFVADSQGAITAIPDDGSTLDGESETRFVIGDIANGIGATSAADGIRILVSTQRDVRCLLWPR